MCVLGLCLVNGSVSCSFFVFKQKTAYEMRISDWSSDVCSSDLKCRHPVIALIEGLCVGGGFGLAALCDLRICGESSRFGVPVKRLGLVESMEELEFQVKKYGANAMLQVLLVGDLLPAAEALRYGIVNKEIGRAHV